MALHGEKKEQTMAAETVLDMPFSDYLALDRISAHGIQKVGRSPLHYRAERDAPMTPSDAMKLGTAVHTGLLEPELWDSVLCAPKVDRRTKAGKEAWAAFQADADEGPEMEGLMGV